MAARVLIGVDGARTRFFGGELIEGQVLISFPATTRVGSTIPISGVKVSLLRVSKAGRSHTKETLTMELIPLERLTAAIDPTSVPFSLSTRQDTRGTFGGGRASANVECRYFLRAVVRRPGVKRGWRAVDVPVEIVPTIDALSAAFAHGIHGEKRTLQRRLLMIPSGSIGAAIDLPRAAFCAGDTVGLTVVLENNSQSRATMVVVRLVQIVSRGRARAERVLVSSGNLAPALGVVHGAELRCPVNLLLPTEGLSPTERSGKLFSVTHAVRLDAQGSRGKTLLTLRTEFVVATTRGMPPGVRPRSVSMFSRSPAEDGLLPAPAPVPGSAAPSAAPLVPTITVATPGASAPMCHRPLADSAESVCVVCQCHRNSNAIIPCGHKVLCDACSSRFVSPGSACPICRRQIVGVLHVYDS